MGHSRSASITSGFHILLFFLTLAREALAPYREVSNDTSADPFLIMGMEYEKHRRAKSFLQKVQRYEDDQGPRFVSANTWS